MIRWIAFAGAVLVAAGLLRWAGDDGASGLDADGTAPRAGSDLLEGDTADPVEGPALAGGGLRPDGYGLRGYSVRGLVRSPDGAPASGAEIVVRARRLESARTHGRVRGRANGAGRFDVDVTALFASDELVTELVIEATDPRHWPATARVHVAGRERTRGAGDWEVDLRLHTAAFVSGRLLDPDGKPASGAFVRLFWMPGLRPGDWPGMPAHTVVASDGRFRLPAHASGRFFLAAWKPGYAPAARLLELELGTETRVEDLYLCRGASLRGTVLINDVPAPGVFLKAVAIASRSRPLSIGESGNGVLRQGAGAKTWQARGESDAQGRFELHGLEPGRYWIRIGGAKTYAIHPDVWKMSGLDADAGGEDQTIDLRGVWAHVKVLGPDGAPYANRRVSVARGRPRTDAEGVVRVLVSARKHVFVAVKAGALRSNLRSIDRVEAGEVVECTVTLATKSPQPQPERGTVRILLEGPGRKEVDVIGLEVRRLADPARWGRGRTLRREAGAFVDRDVPSGAWRIHVRPGGSRDGGGDAWLPVDREVTVVKGAETLIRVPLVPAARLRISARAPAGHYVGSSCVILDADGKPVDVTFSCRTERQSSYGRGYLASFGTNAVHPALAPGPYTVVVKSGGFREVRLPVTLKAGEIRDLDLWLKP